MKIITIDPSMRNTAIVVFDYDPETGKAVTVDSTTITTEKTKNKKIRASSDLIDSCRTLLRGAHEFIAKHNPDAVFAETPSGSQSASGMKSYGVSCFFLATINPSPIEVTPTEVKMASVGRKQASKKEMIEWAYAKHPELNWTMGRGGLPQVTTEEHKADAIGVFYAGLLTPDFSRLKTMLAGQMRW